jgi:hypothetical protein
MNTQNDIFSEDENPRLIPSDNWQTKQRGSNEQEYEIYQSAAESLGWPVKTYDEWLAS